MEDDTVTEEELVEQAIEQLGYMFDQVAWTLRGSLVFNLILILLLFWRW